MGFEEKFQHTTRATYGIFCTTYLDIRKTGMAMHKE